MRPSSFGFLSAFSLVAVRALGVAPPHGPRGEVSAQPPTPAATSIGSPNAGRLHGGARLDAAPYLRVVPFYALDDERWGLPGLVRLIDRAARRVRRQFPDAVLSVGDLSRRGGGEVERHHSHESGRDADLGFYVQSAQGKSLLADHFVPITPSGQASGVAGAQFDDARNWTLIKALLDDPTTHVSYIFVAAPLRARLLHYAERIGAAPALRDRAAEVMMQPRGSEPHDDHFHVRIACPEEQRGTCIEAPRAYASRARPVLVADRRGRAGSGRANAPGALVPLPAMRPVRDADSAGTLQKTRRDDLQDEGAEDLVRIEDHAR